MPDAAPGLTWWTSAIGRWVTVSREDYQEIRAAADSHAVEEIWDAERDALFCIWERDDEPGVPAFGLESAGCVYGLLNECPGTHTFMKLIPNPPQQQEG